MNEELGQAIFENALDAILVTDTGGQGRVVQANPAACSLFGYTTEEFQRLDRAAVFNVTDPGLDQLLRTRDSSGRAMGKATLRRADGSTFLGEVRTALFVDHRTTALAVSVIRDITESERAERLLRESEQRYALVHDRAPFAIALATMPDHRVLSVNDTFLELFECTREEVIGNTAVALGLSTPEAEADLDAMLKERGFIRGILTNRKTARGAERVLSISADLVELAGVRHLLGTAHDVTEREHAIKALRESEERLQLFIENAPVSIAMFDREMRYLSVSRQWIADYRLTGNVIGRSHYEVFPEIPERWKEVHRRSLAGEVLRSDGDRFDRADGMTHWLKWETLPWHTSTGEIGGILIASEDITTEKRAQDDLKDADRRKDEFLATLAHELRNPLAPLLSGLDVLHLTADEEARKRTLATMSRQLGNLVHLVDDLLDISRISRGKLELQRDQVLLSAVIDSAVEISRPIIESRRHVLTVELPEQPVWIDVDSTRMAQVVSNLLNNAAKHAMKPGRIDLRASEERDDIVIRVIDDGIGIAPDDLPRVFDLFAQVGTVRDRAQAGMGIGLSLVRRLVELHGGTVSAESGGLGRGSTFTVRFARAVAAPRAARDAAKEGGAAGAPRVTPSHRILVIDDNVDVADTLATVLELRGYQTRKAHDGASAITAAAEFHPLLVFIDIGLPDMSGYEVARQLRANPASRDAILVALTGWGGDEDKRRSVEAGFDLHLTKPVDLATLEPVLAKLV